jgi:hypothetical protein
VLGSCRNIQFKPHTHVIKQYKLAGPDLRLALTIILNQDHTLAHQLFVR